MSKPDDYIGPMGPDSNLPALVIHLNRVLSLMAQDHVRTKISAGTLPNRLYTDEEAQQILHDDDPRF